MRAPPLTVNRAGRGVVPTWPLPVASVAAALLLSGCWFPKERGQRLEERVERIETGPVKPAAESPPSAESAAKLRQLDATVAEMQTKVNELSSASQRSGPDRAARLDKLAGEVAELRATVEANARRLEGVERTIADLRSRPPSRVSERKSAAPPKAVRKPEPSEHPPERAPQDTTGVLALARDQEKKGEKAVARDLYREYVAKFPRDPGAAQAHFRLGELAFGEGRYQEAIAEYGAVARDFPRSNEAPDALLRTAESMVRMNLRDDAVTVLSEIPKRYPTSQAARRAKERLAELERR